MEGTVGYLFALIFIVVALNFYLLILRRMRVGNKRRKKMNRMAVDEAKQALWRDREIERRLEREQDGAIERVKLREETLALYDEVRRRHADKERLEGMGFSAPGTEDLSTAAKSKEPEGAGYESMRLENPELDAYLSEDKAIDFDTDKKVELLEWNTYDVDDNNMDPFDIFKKK